MSYNYTYSYNNTNNYNYSNSYNYYNSSYYNDNNDNSWTNYWNGGILFVLLFDACIALIGFFIFVFIRHASLTHGDTLVSVTSKHSKLRLWYSKLLHRHSERKREEHNSWFGWIPATIKAPNSQVLEECGRDGFLYLRFQRLLIIVLSIETAIVLPSLLLAYLSGDNDIAGFGITTANHLTSESNMLWLTEGSVILLSIMIIFAIYKTVEALRHNTRHEEIANPRLFSAKIDNFPTNIKDEEIVYKFFEELYPGDILQVYICLNMNTLQKKYHELSKIEQQILHYEVEFSTLETRPYTYPNKVMREVCCPALVRPRVDALQLFYAKKAKLERKIDYLSIANYDSTGVCFVTFKSIAARKRFLNDFRKTTMPKASLGHKLKIHKWIVTSAPNPSDIRWKYLSIGIVEYAVRFIVVNAILFLFLFTFTTPVAMLQGLQTYLQEIDISYNFSLINYLSNSTWGSLLLGYLPSLILLGLTFIIPHILYFTTKLEGYHTRNAQNRAGLLKVFCYQLVAILILPSLTITSLKAVLSHNLGDLEELWRSGGLFPNGSFFVEYILQAAFLGNICDLWRGPELLLEKLNKTRALTRLDLEEAEKVPPFKFGYEYQYFLLQFTITVFYSSVVPLIIPCGLFYLVLKHYVDKYNLLYYYPKAPDTQNKLTTTVIGFTLITLGLYQTTMVVYFAFYRLAPYQALSTAICSLITILVGLYYNFIKPRIEKHKIRSHPDFMNIDAEIFKDAYLHPCYKKQRDYAKIKEISTPLIVEYDTDEDNIQETSLLIN